MIIKKKHYDAFNFWFACTQDGDNIRESLEKTADEFGVSFSAVRKWYDAMDWQGESQRRLREIQKEVERRENRTIAQNQKKYLDILHRLLYDYVEEGLPAKIESVKDLEIVIKNSLLLQDAPTENVKQRTEHSGEVEVRAPLFDRSKMEAILEQELSDNDDDGVDATVVDELDDLIDLDEEEEIK